MLQSQVKSFKIKISLFEALTQYLKHKAKFGTIVEYLKQCATFNTLVEYLKHQQYLKP